MVVSSSTSVYRVPQNGLFQVPRFACWNVPSECNLSCVAGPYRHQSRNLGWKKISQRDCVQQGVPSELRPGLGWLWFLCSTILVSCLAAFAKFPSAQAELGRHYNTLNPSQQNPVSAHLVHPVVCTYPHGLLGVLRPLKHGVLVLHHELLEIPAGWQFNRKCLAWDSIWILNYPFLNFLLV